MKPRETSDNPILATQARYNRSTADSWITYASHRREIADLLNSPGHSPLHRLCVLGAGNCNDLELPALLDQFSEIHLVDIDATAIQSAAERQKVAENAKLHLHGNVDLTGIANALNQLDKRAAVAAVQPCIEQAASAATPPLPGPFDVVLSPCILSQICGYASDRLGHHHPATPALLTAIRNRHLKLLADLLTPGGTGLLVCDLLSSDSFEALSAMRRDDLVDLLNRLDATREHFPGLAPSSVLNFLRSSPLISPLLSDVSLLRPWVWQLTPIRTFLVYAVRIRRSRSTLIL